MRHDSDRGNEIVEMTQQETNELIAEWFEPRPKGIPHRHEQGEASPKEFWQIVGCKSDCHWVVAHDFYEDESANAILRDAMLAAGWSIWLFDDFARLYRNDADLGPIQEAEWFIENPRDAFVDAFKHVMAHTQPDSGARE